LWRGRDGIRIRGFGLAGHICRLGSASELAGLAVLDGAGAIGDSTGITIMRCMAVADISRGAERFITVRTTTAADLVGTVRLSIGELELVRSKEIGERLGDTQRLTVRAAFAVRAGYMVRAACARARSAGTITAESRGAIRHAEARASGAERAAAVAVAATPAAGGTAGAAGGTKLQASP
jgi:hypothetical protein